MSRTIVESIRKLDSVKVHPPMEAGASEEFASLHGFSLPVDHLGVLSWSNGLELYGGYFRLFGLGAGDGVDSVLWNELETWRFAWDERCAEYWCFGETAWGDQYAYSRESLRTAESPEVYFLDSISMTPEAVAKSFNDFLLDEFIRSGREPYDEMIRLSREKFGALDNSLHLVYTPSLLLGGVESIANVHTMNARAAMICNGDLAVQLDRGSANGVVAGVDTYNDKHGRLRLRVKWS